MSWTQTERDALASTIAKGLLQVEYDGRRVTYQSLDQMRKTLKAIDAELAGSAFGGYGSTVYTTFTRD